LNFNIKDGLHQPGGGHEHGLCRQKGRQREGGRERERERDVFKSQCPSTFTIKKSLCTFYHTKSLYTDFSAFVPSTQRGGQSESFARRPCAPVPEPQK
jgi:hypothetical protein